MSKFGFYLFILVSFFSIGTAVAQKADSIKIDTNTLNKYRINPPKNALPVRIRPVLITPQPIPITPIDFQISYWRKSVVAGLNLNQSTFSNNWSGGGVSSFALGANFDFKAEYNKQPFSYTTELLFLYGISKNKGQYSRKTNDRIFYDNKIATQLSKKWYFFGSVSFESQFDVGYQYTDGKDPLLISKFMSPGYFTESIGFEYKPVKYIDIRLGTGTARQTFMLDTTIYHNISGNYGVPPGGRFRNELAFQVVSTINKDIATNMNLQARYALFIPYNNFDRITHRLDATLNARVNRLINVTLNGTVLYDITTNKSVQASQGLALGVIYKFPN
ncbi:MAG: DUF3078 domain-containing protein [Mucilaginibacter sp.]|uniref:DUF3078 domain-containing protein n=1 Tax=Mucilaginibacter sp. TaxID=1882438 RepID=UPI0032668569